MRDPSSARTFPFTKFVPIGMPQPRQVIDPEKNAAAAALLRDHRRGED
jgi:hypothetical protein